MEEVTVIWFSCRRLDILKEAIDSFRDFNDYPIKEFIIANDSGDIQIHEELKKTYPDFTLVYHPENVGLVRSIDLGYKHIKTNYFFHAEDDIKYKRKGFIEKSLSIMLKNNIIEEVWLGNWNCHPIEDKLYEEEGVIYRLVAENYQKGMNGYNDNAWHGYSMACALRRLNDYKRIAPYSDIKWEGTIWHREQAIGEEYHKLGYRTAILTDDYVDVSIGIGKSEYITGTEK